MKKSLRIIALLSAGALCLGMASCSSNNNSKSSQHNQSSESNIAQYTTSAKVEDQFALPASGEEIAVMNINGYGTVKMRLFDQVAPRAVENFKNLAKKGAYNGVPFHRIVEDFMIQTGDTTKVGGDGKSTLEGDFTVELNESVRHYSGALAMARTSNMRNGQSTQFYIVSNQTAKTNSDSTWDTISENTGTTFPDEVRALYKEHGGAPSLDMQYTVFGQVFEGLNVIDSISHVETTENPNSGEKSQPVTPVTVSSVAIETYQG